MVKTIQLTRSKEAIVDDEDFEELNRYSWCCSARGYAIRRDGEKTVYMHCQILSLEDRQVDHINRNKLDNRRANLRPATYSQNGCNREKILGCTSRYKGVFWDGQNAKWQALVKLDGKRRHLGRHEIELVAAIRYDLAARELHGEFCKGNFTDDELARLVEEHKADLSPRKSSRFRGVTWSKRHGKWYAQIVVNTKHHYLGLYKSEDEAAQAYDKAAVELHGQKARLNHAA